MAINVGTLALSISVNEEEVLRKLRKVDAAAKKVGTGQLAAQQSVATAAVAAHTTAEKAKTAATVREVAKRQAVERRAAASMGGMPGLGMIGLSSTVLGAMAFRGIVTAANDFQLLQQRLAQVTSSAAEAKTAFDVLQRASMQLRVPTSDLTELFVKLRQSNAALGFNMGQTVAMTRAFSAALRISGASGQAASSALLQFGQAMAKGRLDGDEFRTVAENASEVLRVLERYLNQTGEGARLFGKKTAITRGEILKLREEGKLAADVLGKALLWDFKNLERQASQLPPTMDQAATSFRNSILKMIGSSSDLQTAMQNIANTIVRVGNFLSSNGNVIIGLATLATKALLAAGAVKALHAAFVLLSNMTPLGRALTAIASGLVALYTYLDLAGDRAKDLFTQDVERRLKTMRDKIDDIAFAADDAAKKLALMALNEKLAADATRQRDLETQARLLERQIASGVGSVGMTLVERTQATSAKKKELAAIKAEINSIASASIAAGKEVQFLMRGGGTPVAGGGDGDGIKDKTRQRIGDLITLLKANYDVFRVTQDLNRELNAQSAIFKNLTLADKDRAQAAQLQDQILKALAERLPDLSKVAEDLGKAIDKSLGETTSAQTEKRLQLLKDNYEELADTITEADRQIILSALARATAELNRVQTLGALTEAQQKYLVKLREEVKLLGELAQRSQQTAGARAQQNAGDPTKTPAQRLGELLDRQLFRQLALAPGQLVADFFAAIGKSIDDGSQSVGAKLRESLGNIFSNVGQNVIQQGFEELMPSFGDMWDILKKGFGTLMKKLGVTTGIFGKLFTKLQALMSDPLFAGPAMIALGAAMVAFGGALGGAATGRDGGGFTGGGIGGLGIGGTTSPIPYVFQGRPYQSPMQGMGGVPEGRNTVNVNATIIGPNDPQAQRQIATLVNNAARRGLVTGSSSRTA